METAGFGRRYIALLLDIVFLEVFGTIATIPLIQSVAEKNLDLEETLLIWTRNGRMDIDSALFLTGYMTVLALIWAVYFVSFLGNNGQTPGKKIAGIQVVLEDGDPINYTTAFVRSMLGYPLSIASLGLGFFWMFFDRNSQTWHDKLAQTIVIRTRT